MFESSQEMAKNLSEVYKKTSFIVISQIFATIFLVVIAWLIVPKVDLAITEQTVFMLWAMMIFLVVGIVFLQRLFLSPKRLKELTKTVGFSGFLDELKIKTTLLGIFCVLIAVFGFLISVMSGNSIEMFRTAAIVFVVFLVIFPRKHIWLKLAEYIER